MEAFGHSIYLQVFFYAFLTAVATGLGALPFLFVKKMPKQRLGIGNAIAAALMIAASFGMIYQGLPHGIVSVIVGIIVGLIFILRSDQYLSRKDVSVGEITGANARKILLILGVMTLHSFAEGVAIGVSFGPSVGFGLFIALAMAIQNIPEGLAIALVMVPRGVKRWKAGLRGIFSSLPQPLMALPAFIFVSHFEPFLPFGLGFAAGAMLWMSFAELLPEAIEDVGDTKVATIATFAVALMILFQAIIGG